MFDSPYYNSGAFSRVQSSVTFELCAVTKNEECDSGPCVCHTTFVRPDCATSSLAPVKALRKRIVTLYVLCDILGSLRGCPCKNRPLDFRPKTEFLQIFRVRQLVHVINKNGNNLAFSAIFQYFWRQFQRTVQNRLNRSVSSQI